MKSLNLLKYWGTPITPETFKQEQDVWYDENGKMRFDPMIPLLLIILFFTMITLVIDKCS